MTDRREQAAAWFGALREDICKTFEAIEDELAGSPLPAGRFGRQPWRRQSVEGEGEGGGGEMALMKGRVFEKVGVNVSVVEGRIPPEYRAAVPGAVTSDGAFWAAGLSLVAHPRSPLVPTAHLNTRMMETSGMWFGGAADLTPTFPVAADTKAFLGALKGACDAHPGADWARFKAWCDRYFFLPHRGESRGVGGIFFDELASGDWDDDFAFVKDVGTAFHRVYPRLIRRHMNKPWTEEQRRAQLVKRGRYVEFNLLYDRGTTFGLKTGGNADAILMSLPPEAMWP